MTELLSKLCEIEVVKLPLICILPVGQQLKSPNIRPSAALPGTSQTLGGKTLPVHMLEMGFLMKLLTISAETFVFCPPKTARTRLGR